VWDGATLDRFLTNPSQLVPGTAMPMAVPSKADRDNIIAFFQSLAASVSVK
jgi:cytochrome c